MNPAIDVITWSEKEDGSSVLVLEMNYDMLIVLARKGLAAIVQEAAAEHGYPDTEGADNGPTREGRDSELFGEIPGL